MRAKWQGYKMMFLLERINTGIYSNKHESLFPYVCHRCSLQSAGISLLCSFLSVRWYGVHPASTRTLRLLSGLRARLQNGLLSGGFGFRITESTLRPPCVVGSCSPELNGPHQSAAGRGLSHIHGAVDEVRQWMLQLAPRHNQTPNVSDTISGLFLFKILIPTESMRRSYSHS